MTGKRAGRRRYCRCHVPPYRTARHPNSLCRGGKAFSTNASSATRNAFYRGRHTCHARLLAFVSGLTNGPPHMARRARLRPDFGPAASPSRPRRSPPATPVVLTMHHAESTRPSDILLTRTSRNNIFYLPAKYLSVQIPRMS